MTPLTSPDSAFACVTTPRDQGRDRRVPGNVPDVVPGSVTRDRTRKSDLSARHSCLPDRDRAAGLLVQHACVASNHTDLTVVVELHSTLIYSIVDGNLDPIMHIVLD
jgi:hypothetical protein